MLFYMMMLRVFDIFLKRSCNICFDSLNQLEEADLWDEATSFELDINNLLKLKYEISLKSFKKE